MKKEPTKTQMKLIPYLARGYKYALIAKEWNVSETSVKALAGRLKARCWPTEPRLNNHDEFNEHAVLALLAFEYLQNGSNNGLTDGVEQ